MASKVYYGHLALTAAMISSSTAAGANPDDNVVDLDPGSTWRSTVITSSTLTINYGAAVTLAAAFAINHNIVAGDTTYVFEASDNNFGAITNTITCTLANTDELRPVMWTGDIAWGAHQYYRFRIVKAAGTYIEIGEVVLATSTYSFVKDFGAEFASIQDVSFAPNFVADTSSRVYRGEFRWERRGFGMDWLGITDTQFALHRTLNRERYVMFAPRGIVGAVPISNVYYGHLKFTDATHIQQETGSLWNHRATFTENGS